MTTKTIEFETKIKEVAYELWEQEGCPEGRDQEHYFRARRIVENGSSEGAAEAPEQTVVRRPRKVTTASAKAAAPKSRARKASTGRQPGVN